MSGEYDRVDYPHGFQVHETVGRKTGILDSSGKEIIMPPHPVGFHHGQQKPTLPSTVTIKDGMSLKAIKEMK